MATSQSGEPSRVNDLSGQHRAVTLACRVPPASNTNVVAPFGRTRASSVTVESLGTTPTPLALCVLHVTLTGKPLWFVAVNRGHATPADRRWYDAGTNGVAVAEALGPDPAVVVAATSKVWATPLGSCPNVYERALLPTETDATTLPPTSTRTWYPVIGEPPSAGAVHSTVAAPHPAM